MYRPIWDFEEWEDLSGDLNEKPRDHHVRDGNLVNAAPPQFPEETLRIHWLCFATQSFCEQGWHCTKVRITTLASVDRDLVLDNSSLF